MVEYEEYEYEDEEYDDEEYDEYDDEYEDDYEDEYYNNRRYDEDFDAVSVEPQVKTAIGIDGFAIIFSFVVLLAATFLLARYTLLENYDQSFLGVIPPKEKPDTNQTFEVVNFGMDKSISDVYNYAILDGGANKGLEKGMILYMGDKGVAKKKEDASGNNKWGICFVVSEVYETTSRANIVRVMTYKKTELANAVRSIEGSGTESDSKTNEWLSLASLNDSMKNLNWILKDETISADMKKVRIAPWDNTNQWILLEYQPTPRVAKKK